MPANVLQKIIGHNDLRTTLEVYTDVFANYEKEHAEIAYNYYANNGILINSIINT